MMSSILNSSNLMFATFMVVSSTAVILAFFKQNKADISPAPSQLSDESTSWQAEVQILRPCISSGGNNKEGKKKKVHFAENVEKKNGREGDIRNLKKSGCRSAFQGIQMPQNRVALYNGLLRDRSHRMGYSF